jgi:hypothetical protein
MTCIHSTTAKDAARRRDTDQQALVVEQRPTGNTGATIVEVTSTSMPSGASRRMSVPETRSILRCREN